MNKQDDKGTFWDDIRKSLEDVYAKREELMSEKQTEEKIRKIVREELTNFLHPLQTVEVKPERTAYNIECKCSPPKQKKKIDWSKMPVDTLVEVDTMYLVAPSLRYFSHADEEGKPKYFAQGKTSLNVEDKQNTYYAISFKLAPADKQPWNVWFAKEDSACPLPEGVLVEVILRDGSNAKRCPVENLRWGKMNECFNTDIIAYRIIGIDKDNYEY